MGKEKKRKASTQEEKEPVQKKSEAKEENSPKKENKDVKRRKLERAKSKGSVVVEEVRWQKWRTIEPIGTELFNRAFDDLDYDFNHLRDDLEDDGEIANLNKKVFLLAASEPTLLPVSLVKGFKLPTKKTKKAKEETNEPEKKIVYIPTIIAVVCDKPLPSKVAYASVQGGEGSIDDMKKWKLGWVPFSIKKGCSGGVGVGAGGLDSCRTNFYGLTFAQRQAATVHLSNDARAKYEYLVPYCYIPSREKRLRKENVTIVIVDELGTHDIDFDPDMGNTIAETIDEAISENNLHPSSREKAIQQIKEQRENLKKKNEMLANMFNPEELQAFENMIIYKYYPQNEELKIEQVPTTFRYFKNADVVKPVKEVAAPSTAGLDPWGNPL